MREYCKKLCSLVTAALLACALIYVANRSPMDAYADPDCSYSENTMEIAACVFPEPPPPYAIDVCDIPEDFPNSYNTREIAPELVALNASRRAGGYRGIVEHHPFRKLRIGMTVTSAEIGALGPADCDVSLCDECSNARNHPHVQPVSDEEDDFEIYNPQIFRNPNLVLYDHTWAGRFDCLLTTFSHIKPLGPFVTEAVQPFPEKFQFCYLNDVLDFAFDHKMTVDGYDILKILPYWMIDSNAYDEIVTANGCPGIGSPCANPSEDLGCALLGHLDSVLQRYLVDDYAGRGEVISSWSVATEVVVDNEPYTEVEGDPLNNFLASYDPESPPCSDDPICSRLPWHRLGDDRGQIVRDIFAKSLEYGDGETVKHPEFVLYEHGAEFASDYAAENINNKFESVNHVLDTLMEDTETLITIGLEMHVPAYGFLEKNDELDGVQLSRAQLSGVRASLKTFAEKANIEINEFDLRMGIPFKPSGCTESPGCSTPTDPDCLPGEGNCEWNWMTQLTGRCWEVMSYDERLAVQADVYEALMNIFLSTPRVKEITFWQPFDWDSWYTLPVDHPESTVPFTPRLDLSHYPLTGFRPLDAADPGLFTMAFSRTLEDPDAHEPADFCQIQSFYAPKPSYFAVERALKRFFGPAMEFVTASQKELVRFTKAGDVVVFTGHIQEEQTDLNAKTGPIFQVKNASGDTVAVIADDSENTLYITGSAFSEDPETGDPPSGLEALADASLGGLQIADSDGNLQVWITQDGDLYARHEIIEEGISRNVAGSDDDELHWILPEGSCR